MNFTLPQDLRALQQRTRDFIAEEIIPFERDERCTPHGPTDELRAELISRAREAGLLSPQMPVALGGMGLDYRARAVVFEEAGYSPLGPVAMNIAAPDEGNMTLLEAAATPGQKSRWLEPLVDGRVRSCFCLTEPYPGAGSDPAMLSTIAETDGGVFRISGQKWFTTGAEGASFAIIVARHVDGEYDGQASLFIAEMDQPEIHLVRMMDALDTCYPGGHGVLRFSGLQVPAGDILGEPGQGMKYAQVRMAPARLAHCMQWLGQARRANDVLTAYTTGRRAFGKLLAEQEGVALMLADNQIDLHSARLAIQHCAWSFDRSGPNRYDSSVAKVIASEACWRVVDRCVQLLGGQGVTHDTIVARIFADMRSFRIYDGPSEAHRWSISHHVLRHAAPVPAP